MTQFNPAPAAKSSNNSLVFQGAKFGMVPTALITDTELSNQARIVASLLWSYRDANTEQAWPRQTVLAEQLGWTPSYISQCITELEKRKWLRSKLRKDVDSKWKGNPNARIYELTAQRGIFETDITPSNNLNRPEELTASVTNVTSARTPVPRPPPDSKTSQKPKTKRPYWGEVEPLVKHFAAVTQLPLPPLGTQAKFKAANRLWRDPLTEILSMAGGNISSAKDLITRAVHEMANLTMASPQSIHKVCLDLYAKSKRTGSSGVSRDAFLEDLRGSQ